MTLPRLIFVLPIAASFLSTGCASKSRSEPLLPESVAVQPAKVVDKNFFGVILCGEGRKAKPAKDATVSYECAGTLLKSEKANAMGQYSFEAPIPTETGCRVFAKAKCGEASEDVSAIDPSSGSPLQLNLTKAKKVLK